MPRKQGTRLADGWWWRGIGTAALLAATAGPLWTVGWVLAHVSDAIGRLG